MNESNESINQSLEYQESHTYLLTWISDDFKKRRVTRTYLCRSVGTSAIVEATDGTNCMHTCSHTLLLLLF
jgi:hypothetical protein